MRRAARGSGKNIGSRTLPHNSTCFRGQFNLFCSAIQVILPDKTSYFGRQNNLYSNAPKIALLNTSQVIYRNEVNCSIEMT